MKGLAPLATLPRNWEQLGREPSRSSFEEPSSWEEFNIALCESLDTTEWTASINMEWTAPHARLHQVGMESERDSLRAEVARLVRMVQELSQQVVTLTARLDARHAQPQTPAVQPPHSGRLWPEEEWIHGHLDVLAQYPDRFVAVDLKLGVVVLESPDDEDFNRQLLAYFKQHEEARGRLLMLHTSLYV